MRTVTRWLRTPKGIFALMLVCCTAVAGTSVGWVTVLPGLAVAVAVAVALDAPLLRWRNGRWVLPDGAMLTGWLIALVLSPHEAWWIAGATSALGIAAKHLLHAGRANVLNPAAAGLVASYHLFDSGQSWWGAMPEGSVWWILLLVALGAVMAQRLHKATAALVFLGTWFAAATVVAYVGDPVRVVEVFRAPDLQAAVFFAAFMLTDPPTSPPKVDDQIVYGILVAVAAFAVLTLVGAAHFLLSGVLVGNLWEGWRKRRVRARHHAAVAGAARAAA